MKRRKQKAETLCQGSSLFWVSCPSLFLYRVSTSFRMCSNNLRISLNSDQVSEQMVRFGQHILRAITPMCIDGVPYYSAPLHQLLNPAIDVLGTFATAIWVDFNSYLFEANLTNYFANARLQKSPPVEGHCKFHRLRKYSIASK